MVDGISSFVGWRAFFEIVAFGSAIKGSILNMKQGDEVRIISADARLARGCYPIEN